MYGYGPLGSGEAVVVVFIVLAICQVDLGNRKKDFN